MLGFRRQRGSPLERRLGYVFRDASFLDTALVHRSFRFETDGVDVDNQRLEYLGDAALGLAAAEALYERFAGEDEGGLTALRSRVTSGRMLTRIARGAGLGESLKMGRGEELSGGRNRPSNLADAMEAVLGAAYLDGGMKAVRKIFETMFLPLLEEPEGDGRPHNPKGELQQLAHARWSCEPRYETLNERGPPHRRSYRVAVEVRGRRLATGEGFSKQGAEIEAAAGALRVLAEEETRRPATG